MHHDSCKVGGWVEWQPWGSSSGVGARATCGRRVWCSSEVLHGLQIVTCICGLRFFFICRQPILQVFLNRMLAGLVCVLTIEKCCGPQSLSPVATPVLWQPCCTTDSSNNCKYEHGASWLLRLLPTFALGRGLLVVSAPPCLRLYLLCAQCSGWMAATSLAPSAVLAVLAIGRASCESCVSIWHVPCPFPRRQIVRRSGRPSSRTVGLVRCVVVQARYRACVVVSEPPVRQISSTPCFSCYRIQAPPPSLGRVPILSVFVCTNVEVYRAQYGYHISHTHVREQLRANSQKLHGGRGDSFTLHQVWHGHRT